MKRETYRMIEDYMLRCMADSAHDREHVYRVLYTALHLAEAEENVDLDVLTAACLLHDIGRQEQFADPSLCHAQVGGEKAYRFLKEQGFEEGFACHVRSCIEAHRFRKINPPRSIEAKILFDADKLDVTGSIGIARTLLYQGQAVRPLYTLNAEGEIDDGTGCTGDSFFREFKFKLEKIYDRFYTARGRELALQRRQAAVSFYESLLAEVREDYACGQSVLEDLLKET